MTGAASWLETPRIYVLLLALTLVLRFPTLLDSMYLVDEGYSGAIASEILYGGRIYETAVDMRAPFIYYTYYAVFLFAGQNNLFAVHILAILIVFTIAGLVRSIGRSMAGDAAGGWAAIGYVVFLHTYLPRDTLPANVEIFTLLPQTLSLLCFLVGVRRRSAMLILSSGALCCIAAFYRQPSAACLGAFALYLGYTWLIARTLAWRSAVYQGILVLIGFSVCAWGLIAIHQAQGNWEELVFWVWGASKRYLDVDTTVSYVLRRFFLSHLTFVLAGALIWYFGIRQLIVQVRGLLVNPDQEKAEWLLIAGWTAISYVSLYLGWRFSGHYHVMILPTLAILAGKAFADYIAVKQKQPLKSRGGSYGFMAGAALIPALGFLIMAFVIREQTIAFKPITRYIAASTAPADRIFVWGSAPHIYSFSNRRMASRMPTCAYLVGMFASRPRQGIIDESRWIVPGSWDMLKADFNAHPPELIIDMSPVSPDWKRHPMSKYPDMAACLGGYRKETTVAGADIYRRIPPES